MPPRWQLCALLALAAGCAAGRKRLGEITLERVSDRNYAVLEYTVLQGRIVSPDLDLTLEDSGCISGVFASWQLQLCQEGGLPVVNAQRWAGSGGDFLVEVAEGGKVLRASGALWPGGIKPGVTMQVSVPMGTGPQWDELRRQPALLAVAAAVAGIRAGARRLPDGLRKRRPRGP
jgi:hypothetical protein